MTQSVEQEVLARIKVLHDTVWDDHASGPAVREWLANFTCPPEAPSERLHALCLLSHFMYFGSRQMRALLKALYRDKYKYPIVEQIRRTNADTVEAVFIQGRFKETLSATRFLEIGNPSESGVHLLYYYRQGNQLKKKYFINAHKIFSVEDGKRVLRYLAARDATYAVFRSGPIEEIVVYRDFMGWKTPWYSTANSGNALATRDGGDLRCSLRTDDKVFQTYETKSRGIEVMLPTLQLLDLTPYGRQETWEDSPVTIQLDRAGAWWRRDGRPVAQWTRTDKPVE